MFRELLSRAFGALVTLLGLAILGGAAWADYDTGQWHYLGAVILGAPFIGVGWPRLFPTELPPLPVDQDDPAMEAAMEQARREVDRFKRGMTEGRKQAFMKFPLKTRNGEVEHIWGIVHSIAGGETTLSLANDPVDESSRADPRFQVPVSELEDWMLVADDGMIDGGYTTKAMAQIYKREKGYLPRALRKELSAFKDFRNEPV